MLLFAFKIDLTVVLTAGAITLLVMVTSPYLEYDHPRVADVCLHIAVACVAVIGVGSLLAAGIVI
jgi:uncharacterized membrane protein YccC